MITIMTGTGTERLDVLGALRENLGGTIPFQVLVQGQITDYYPSGWASTRRQEETMPLLDTPQWKSLTVRQKNISLAISGNGPLKFRSAQHRDIRRLEELEIITVDWAEGIASERS